MIVELKAVEQLTREHDAQVINYLKASCVDVGLHLNFNPQAEFRRKVMETAWKGRIESLVFTPESF